MRYRVLPYRQGSKSAKALSEALGGKVLLLEGSKYKPAPQPNIDTVINWGNTDLDSSPIGGYYLYNPQIAVRSVSNKLRFFQMMCEAGCDNIIPRFWAEAADVPDDAFPIVCRTTLAGHSGAGIVIADTRGQLVPAPLYTQYIKKQDEYRIHVGVRDGETVIISEQRKARKLDVPDHEVNWQVRNLANGFVYVRQDVNPPGAVTDAAKRAIEASGLDFAAMDVIYNDQQERAYVLEGNCAPGLEGQTVEDYANFFRGI